MRALAAFMLLPALLAGCTGEGTPQGQPEPTEQAGCIEGVVVDAAIRPIEGATVAVPRVPANATTPASGEFAFCGLEPGLYVVQVSKADYLPSEQNAVVAAAQSASLQVVLPADPAPKPFHRTMPFTGFINASAGQANSQVDPVLEQFGIRSCACAFHFTAEGPLDTLIVEATWEDSIPPGPAGPTQFYVEVQALESGNSLHSYMRDPGYYYVDGAEFDAEDRSFRVSLYADDVWPAVQQEFEMYVTAFYYGNPPEGWSFIEGSR